MICVTNRHLVEGDYLAKLSEVITKRPKAIVLREKDMSEQEYHELAKQVIPMCERSKVMLILHYFESVAIQLRHPALQVPFSSLQQMSSTNQQRFSELGCAVHTVEEAKKAELLGATYLVAGHIFETDCKKGLPGKGLSFLEEVCQEVSIPVYAIGGITPDNLSECLRAGAKDGMMMSGYMRKR